MGAHGVIGHGAYGYRGRFGESLREAGHEAVSRCVRLSELYDAQRASVASPQGVANLDSSTHLRWGCGYSVTVMDFGDGIVEARACVTERRTRPISPKILDQNEGERAERKRALDAEKRAWSSRRAARSLRYRCLALKADRMMTLTKRGKFESVEDVYRAWRSFHELLRKFPNLKFGYVAVPELHGDRQTWHLHVAIRGFLDVGLLRRLWYRALGGTGKERGEDTPGSINIRWFHSSRKASLAVASYMAKYLGKSFSATQGTRKSYWASKGLVPLRVERYWEPYGDDVLIRVRDNCAPMVPDRCMWRVFEWEYVGYRGFVMKTY